MTKHLDPRQRWRGLLCLAIAAALLNWGDLIFKPALHGWKFAAYWTGCLGFSAAAVVLALLDVRAVRRDIRLEHTRLTRLLLREVRLPGQSRIPPARQSEPKPE